MPERQERSSAVRPLAELAAALEFQTLEVGQRGNGGEIRLAEGAVKLQLREIGQILQGREVLHTGDQDPQGFQVRQTCQRRQVADAVAYAVAPAAVKADLCQAGELRQGA